jgi:hypothetical protein
MEKIIIEIPNKAEVRFLTEVINRLGFKFDTLDAKLNRFVKNAPRKVSFTDNEIMEEIYAVRKKRRMNAKD